MSQELARVVAAAERFIRLRREHLLARRAVRKHECERESQPRGRCWGYYKFKPNNWSTAEKAEWCEDCKAWYEDALRSYTLGSQKQSALRRLETAVCLDLAGARS